MKKFHKVTDYLYRGGEPSLEDISMLKDKYNIKKIISLDSEVGDKIHETCKNLKIKHIIFPLTDGTDPSNTLLKEFILPLIENGGPTYIHCLHGKDRTSMAVAMFRVLNGWPIDDALKEAASFGMGFGLPSRETFYQAVKELADNNNSDAVEIQRETLENNPGINDQTVPNFGQTSFAPYLDVEVDHLNRSAATKVYKYCKPNEVLRVKQYWFYSPEAAKKYKEQGDRLYSAVLSSNIKSYRYDNANKSNIYYAMTNDADIIVFNDYMLLLNQDAIVNISEDDVNDLDIGLHDNYTGMAPYTSFNGGGLMESGYGGFAGPVSLPNSGLQL